MRCTGMLRVVLVALLVTGVGLADTGAGWAQQAPPSAPGPGPASDSPGRKALAALAGYIGSSFYIAFKVGAICPGMALASGVSLAATGGERATAAYLLRVGCTGTYLITSEMIRGQEEFQGSGAGW